MSIVKPLNLTGRSASVLVWVLAAAAWFFVIVVLGVFVAASAPMTAAETAAVVAVNGSHSEVFDAIALSIDTVFSPRVAVVVAAVGIAVAGIIGRSWRASLRMGTLIFVPSGATELIKEIVQRPRPDISLLSHPVLVEPSSFSYPSGHTAIAAAIGMSVVMMVVGWRYRPIVCILAIAAAVLAASSRVYLGAHYPSDVFASLVLVPVFSLCLAALIDRTPLAWHHSAQKM